ncbi:NAD/NADP octopine/nopaline dehydrogenase family protein [Pigmentiphaga litoralis]|uniref:Opine dehydrogenase n=1 Tax=Pigmentiphaga litoralis TaxID=516702 RepID=A0A7Y9LLB8_9BURK|nr:NAD/NADP octopine/nopaline dehydrogenase family protein [Pigmentiphaga litoralis]NYE23989.1 opine dehydrogenase [Pigmentiphaga litoralis]NYE82397.1 opine dehydrogenase [Pigmentiphaga litoralis]
MTLSVSAAARAPRVTVVGAGPIGCATAAALATRGHHVAMWSPTGRRLSLDAPAPGNDSPSPAATARFACTGALDTNIRVDWLTDVRQVSHADVVIVCLPGNAYADVLATLAPHWRTGQQVHVSGALSLVSLWMAEEAARRGVSLQVAAWGTTLTTAYFRPDGVLHLNRWRDRIDLACTGAGRADDALATCEHLFGKRFVASDSLLAPTLANINPIAHAAEVIPNLSRMERGETWPLFGCFNRAVARLADRLDAERLAVALAFGLSLPTLQQHYQKSYDVPFGPLEDMAQAIHERGMGPNGPASLSHRYVIEDAPFGLAFQEALGRLANVPTPTLSSALTIFDAVYATDWRQRNFLPDALGLAADTPASLQARCRQDAPTP